MKNLRDLSRLTYLLLFFLTGNCLTGWAQDKNQYFTEFGVQKHLKSTDKWSSSLNVSWKNNYTGSNNWKRLTLGYTYNRPLAYNWGFMAGLGTFYTINHTPPNFMEVRPWGGLKLKNNFTSKLVFNQQIKWEVRGFIYNDDTPTELRNRFRYRFGASYPLKTNIETSEGWWLNVNMELYLLREPATNEQYASSREISGEISRHLRNNKSMSVSYTVERFNKISNPENPTGHSLTATYSF